MTASKRVLLLMSLSGFAFSQSPSSNNHILNRLVVQHRAGTNQAGLQALKVAGARLEKSLPEINVSVLTVPEQAADRIAAALDATGLFNFVEQDGIAHSGQSVTPNDPYFPSQWHLTQISGPQAWAETTGAASVTIAMIDSGVDSTHPDLTPKLVPGWNFLTGTSNTADDLGHGTATSGTAGAATNDAMGVSGVAWKNSIMPLVVLNSSDYAAYSDIASAIDYAVNHGIRIINISIGGSSSSSTLQSAVDYAWNQGAVIFASAMNNSSSTPYYPAACNHVVAVSATAAGDVFASFSNYGSWIDLSAPGNNILTTTEGGGYGYWYGTSFSSPIAAATAALALSVQPGLSAAALVSLLEQNSDDLGTPGWDEYFGYGRVNAYKAVVAAASTTIDTTPPTSAITSPSAGATVSGTIAVTGTATDNVGVVRIELWVDGQLNTTASSPASPFSCSWNTVSAANGPHSLVVKAYDAAGNVGSSPAVSVNVSNATVRDTQPPTVTITSPANGAIVSGNVSVNASATDNVGVSQISIYIDGTLVSTATSSQDHYAWNTKKTASGSHTIKATAWDAAGNSASTSITVTR